MFLRVLNTPLGLSEVFKKKFLFFEASESDVEIIGNHYF